jgi:hypothetical protein
VNNLLCHSYLPPFFPLAAPARSRIPRNLVLAHDQQFLAVDLDFRAAVFTEENAIARFHVEGLTGSVFFILAFAYGDDFAFLGFFLGSIGMMMPPRICSPSSTRLTITRS